MASSSYDAEYFAWQKSGAATSAAAMLPVVFEILGATPRSTLDVGCGTGAWLRTATELGVGLIHGVDGNAGELVIPANDFQRVDLNAALPSVKEERAGKFDLVICMEVAEHLRPERGESLVRELCALGSVVLFSAAVPEQGGPGSGPLHINERWQSYWAALFEGEGYRAVDVVRPRIWDDSRISWWYRQNAFLGVEPASTISGAPVRDVVHPVMWNEAKGDLWTHSASPRALVRQLPHAVARRLRSA
jgi:SAM-dependent methyltransferase